MFREAIATFTRGLEIEARTMRSSCDGAGIDICPCVNSIARSPISNAAAPSTARCTESRYHLGVIQFLRRDFSDRGGIVFQSTAHAPDAVVTAADTDDVQVATLAYGVGNWYVLRGDKAQARHWFERSGWTTRWRSWPRVSARMATATWAAFLGPARCGARSLPDSCASRASASTASGCRGKPPQAARGLA